MRWLCIQRLLANAPTERTCQRDTPHYPLLPISRLRRASSTHPPFSGTLNPPPPLPQYLIEPPSVVVPEADGLRLLSPSTHDYIRRVPRSLVLAFTDKKGLVASLRK